MFKSQMNIAATAPTSSPAFRLVLATPLRLDAVLVG